MKYTLVCGYSNYVGHCETSGIYDEGYKTSDYSSYQLAKKAMREAIEKEDYYEVFILDENDKQIAYYG